MDLGLEPPAAGREEAEADEHEPTEQGAAADRQAEHELGPSGASSSSRRDGDDHGRGRLQGHPGRARSFASVRREGEDSRRQDEGEQLGAATHPCVECSPQDRHAGDPERAGGEGHHRQVHPPEPGSHLAEDPRARQALQDRQVLRQGQEEDRDLDHLGQHGRVGLAGHEEAPPLPAGSQRAARAGPDGRPGETDSGMAGGQRCQQQHEGLVGRATVHLPERAEVHLAEIAEVRLAAPLRLTKHEHLRVSLSRVTDDVLRSQCNRFGVRTVTLAGVSRTRDELIDLLILRIVG